MNARRSGALIAALVLLSAGLATAQSTPDTAQQQPAPAPGAVPQEPPPATTSSGRAVEEQITVTGTRVRRKDLTTPAPVTVLTREQWQESGKLSIGEFLQTMPEQGNAPNFQLNNGGVNYAASGSTNVNLRSLGVPRTLVLINGRRVVPAGVGASPAVDLNSIPAAAVERVEVLKDGASAIYGSDAIAGVVNVITRKGFNGTEVGAQYGITDKGDAQTFDAQGTIGRTGDAGSFILSAGFYNQKESWLRDRGWSRFALTYDYTNKTTTSGGSFRTPQGTVGLPVAANGVDPLPACLANPLCNHLVTTDPNWKNDAFIRVTSVPDATALNAWRVMDPNTDPYNFAEENYLTIPSTRIQAFASGDTKLAYARPYFEVSYVQRNTQQNAAPMPLNPGDYTIGGGDTPISVSANSMYNPFGVPLDFAGRRLVEFGHRTYTEELATFRVVTGLDGTLPDIAGPLQGWYWDASMNYGRTAGTFTTNGSIRNSRIADAVGPSMLVNGVPRCVSVPGDPNTVIPGCVPLNLFGGPNNGSIDPAQIANLGFEGTSRAFDALFSINANATGELFTIGADRPLSLAIGYEFRRQSGAQIADPIAASGDSADFNFKSTSGHFTSNEGYAELTLPLLANVPGVRELEASAAGRFVHYSTFGDNFTYKFGARYSPVQDFTLRGTFSTAFRAPNIGELYLGQSETAPVATDPCNINAGSPPALIAQCTATGVPPAGSGDQGNQELARQGGNSQLQPETAKIFTAGLVFQPTFLRNFSVTLDYYNMAVDETIGTIGVPSILAGCYPAAAGSSAAPNSTYCSYIHRAANGRILFINDVNQNIGDLRTDGLDLSIRYALPTGLGRFGFAFDGTYLHKYDRSGLKAVSTYDLQFPLPRFKANAGLNYSIGGLAAGGIVRFIGDFKECGAFDSSSGSYVSAGGVCAADATAVRTVGANVTLDLHASYTLSSTVGRTMLLVGMNNVFDQTPQFVYSANLANSDPTIYDYVGRFVYGRVQHTF